ncbi:glucose-6-phosphate isomerase [Candidatus Saccharibacteria bacterium]|nr:glucose-6-phosphate isomerase [Candidatus Saccharibacteria bacterium]
MLRFHATSPEGQDETINLDLNPAKAAVSELREDPMAGWFSVPVYQTELEKIKKTAAKINQNSEYLVCIGIGGSYLGHKAIIDALAPISRTKILYAGNNLSEKSLNKVLNEIEGKDFSVNVISKSGTTLEPSLAFEALKQKLKARYKDEDRVRSRIFATTDAKSGALHDEAKENGYETFVVPDNIGGRYSVLTAVGLLPLAVAGVDIDALLAGATAEKDEFMTNFAKNSNVPSELKALTYATIRQHYHGKYHDVEILAAFEPELQTFEEWWKQLFGESEGKNGKGIFPASVIYTTDLHSLGQYLQDGRRNILETFLKIPLTGYNEIAERATIAAHKEGKIPVFEIELDKLDEENLGRLIYFFELACAVSAKLQGANPFDQPGVETYKRNMKKEWE